MYGLEYTMNENWHLIEGYINRNDFKKAETLISKLMRSVQSNVEQERLLFYRARTRLLSGRPDDSLADITSLYNLTDNLSLSPNLIELRADAYFARFELASVGFADRGDTTKAKQDYNQIIDQYSNYNNIGWVYYQLGRIYLTENNIGIAEEFFRQALISPSTVKSLTSFCYERLGFIAYYEMRDFNAAQAFVERAIDTFPRSENTTWLVQAHILLSRVHKSKGAIAVAREAAEKAVQLAELATSDTKQPLSEALLNICELLSDISGYDKEAIHFLNQFIQHSRKPPGIDVTWARVHEMLGNAQFNLGYFSDATASYETVLHFNPDHPWNLLILQRIAECHYHLRQYPKVVEVVNYILDTAKGEGHVIVDFHIYDLLGNALFALKRYSQAVMAYESALKLAPPNTEQLTKIQSFHNLALKLL